jgi:hypothetical protein
MHKSKIQKEVQITPRIKARQPFVAGYLAKKGSATKTFIAGEMIIII